MTFHHSYFESKYDLQPREAKLLALLHNYPFVTYDQISDELWPEGPPKRVKSRVSVYVTWLRKEGYLIGNSRGQGGGGYYLAQEQREAELKKWLDQQSQL